MLRTIIYYCKLISSSFRPGYDVKLRLGYDVKLHSVTKAQFSTIEVLVAMPMTRWEFRIAPATCLKMLVKRFADVQ